MAVILRQNTQDESYNPVLLWENITNADTVEVVTWQGGSGNIEVSGVFDGATVRTIYSTTESGLYEVKDAEAPDGGTFTKSGVTGITNLTFGYIGFTITGGGGSQDITIKVTKSEKGYT